MEEDHFTQTKTTVLSHIERTFEEIEKELSISHQEKYALLEDAFENASDADELRVAFDQWYSEHAEDVGFEEEAHELWDQALASADDDEFFDDDEEEEDNDEDGI
ncbi:MAG: hypothetical protein ABII02_01150 [Candidatus Magasanikbacteria bacterium]